MIQKFIAVLGFVNVLSLAKCDDGKLIAASVVSRNSNFLS